MNWQRAGRFWAGAFCAALWTWLATSPIALLLVISLFPCAILPFLRGAEWGEDCCALAPFYRPEQRID